MSVVEEQIKPYFETPRFTLLCGDCRIEMRDLSDCSIDSVVCDPPYHLTQVSRAGSPRNNDPETPYGRTRIGERGFMGKTWDGGDIAHDPVVWQECLRVLRPGGHLLAFGGSRTYHRLACAIEDAGFEIRDQIQWIYGSGFPKSLDVGKAIDARPGVTRHGEFAVELREAMIAKGITNSFDVAEMVVGKRTGAVANWLKYQWPEAKWWPALRDALGMDHKWGDVIAQADRDVSGSGSCGPASIGFAREQARSFEITSPATDDAKQWNGWGTALKPAHEPIVLARKPLLGTVAENVLQHGTGGLNIDGCRVATAEHITPFGSPRKSVGGLLNKVAEAREGYEQNDLGRWPANVIHDGSDEVLAGFPETESGNGNRRPNGGGEFFKGINPRVAEFGGDGGSAARFFYCAKATQEDRTEGLADGSRNPHPTVKPTELMRYFCRLITPPGGLVLDPFCGSGSTGKAAMLEGFRFIGIELNEDYCQLAQRRIEAVTKQGLLFT